MARSISDLPGEMITQILIRLPVKSLLQCKPVCKPWLSLISSPKFIKSHLHRAIVSSSNIKPTLLTTRFSLEEAEELDFENFLEMLEPDEVEPAYDAHQQEQERRSQLVNRALLKLNGQDSSSSPIHFDRIPMLQHLFYSRKHHVNGCCHGIICVSDFLCPFVYLWNPSIGQCKELRTPFVITFKVGFGYDSISDDYKLFRIVNKEICDVIPTVQVYSTNADSWREFQAPILKNQKFYRGGNVVINGTVLYFDGGNKLVSFDLHEEIFRLVQYPKLTQSKRSDVMDFEGSVAMVIESGSGTDLWTLDDDVPGGRESTWTKRFGIVSDSETWTFLSCYLGAGQFYGEKVTKEDSMSLFKILYDYEKKETKFFGQEKVHTVLNYTQTLVSLNGFEPVQSLIQAHARNLHMFGF